jgi:hypothetical protein
MTDCAGPTPLRIGVGCHAAGEFLFGPEWQGAHRVIHCTDDSVHLLRHAALALGLAPGPVREMRPVSAERSQAGMKRSFHNTRAAKIARSRSKPADLKVRREIHLKIANRLDSF